MEQIGGLTAQIATKEQLEHFEAQFAKEIKAINEATYRDEEIYKQRLELRADYLLQRSFCKRHFDQLYQYVEFLQMTPYIEFRSGLVQKEVIQRASASIDRLHQRTPPDQYGNLKVFLKYVGSWIALVQDVAPDVQQEFLPLQRKLQNIEGSLNPGE